MKFRIRPKNKCPCGSGKEYRKCHSPKRDKSDNNIWKGPGYPQTVYFGYKEPLSGFWFEKDKKGEFVLLKGEDRIPVARYFCIDESILSCKSIVRLLSVSLENDRTAYTGSLEVKGNSETTLPIIVGCIDADSVDSFDANLSGQPVTYERGDWVIFIGEDDNPIARIKKTPQWLRFLKASGYLIEFKPPGEINFRLLTKAKGFNLFTLALPFNEIEVSHPVISLHDSPLTCQIEIENENITWDLVLHQTGFSEKQRLRKDSKVIIGEFQEGEIQFDGFDKSTRKYFSKPSKLRIGLSLPDESITIGKFSKTLEATVRSIAEDGSFNLEDNDKRILEADFRDHMLTILKSMRYFAYAEPARRGGFIDILLKKGESEAIIEFKVWGRRKYKEIINQVLGYGTAWTTEFATVMINPNKEPVTEKFVENAKKSTGFKGINTMSEPRVPLEKLISSHFLINWEKHIAITHYIINTNQFS